jgi:hypothetical protein
VRTDITEPLGLASTFWLRVPFEVPAGAGQVELALTYDDGIIAWVDGREVYRNNADPGTATDRPSSRALSPVRIPLGERVGPGVITLLVVNAAADDDVFFAEAAVVAPALEVDAQARYLPEPTPNAPNIVGPVDLGPIIFDLDRHQVVGAADPLVIGARVLPTQAPITTVTLVHRVMFDPRGAHPHGAGRRALCVDPAPRHRPAGTHGALVCRGRRRQRAHGPPPPLRRSQRQRRVFRHHDQPARRLQPAGLSLVRREPGRCGHRRRRPRGPVV